MDVAKYANQIYKSFIDYAMNDDVGISFLVHRKSQILLTNNLYYECVGMRSIFIRYNDEADQCDIFETVDSHDESVARCEVEINGDQVSISSLWKIRRMWMIENSDISDLSF